ncbi:Y-family DNA polymerase [Robbsia andropogonis]|uniref:Y-family DNA polymerase n=1 Tax=Robbsia andropogonis TaxID=28092 RepID=UPI002A6A37B3|nr:DNA polymerase Y family protein [Robbsia andropogonis]
MRLWIGVHLPYLCLEAYRPTWTPDGAGLVVLERESVLAVSRAARDAGVHPGMRRAGALTLAPHVTLVERDELREAAVLQALGMALLRFSPQVTLASEATVLMDIGASLRLFGGIRALRRHVIDTVKVLALTGRVALSPTGTGAWLLARRAQIALSETSLRRKITPLPVALLPQARPAATWLAGVGCHTLGAVLRLPRAGLSRRADPGLLLALDRAVGAVPEGFAWLIPPPTFDARQELPDRTDRADLIACYAQALVVQLTGWLAAGFRAITALTILLEHERGRDAVAPTEIKVMFAEPANETTRIQRLIKERIERTELPAPAIVLRLRVDDVRAAEQLSDSLFPEPGGTPADHARLIELLAARLGEERLRRPAPIADHRPEVANRWVPYHRPGTIAPAKHLRRPLWLLDKPIELKTRNHRPFYGSALRLASAPERIEAGWWSEPFAARDYFVAQGADHRCYWIYRERGSLSDDTDPRWFLHGLFG